MVEDELLQNPFMTTYSKIPADSYIPTEQVEEIVENFRYDKPTESVYKITGVRGSGKTVLLAKVEDEIGSFEDDKWYIYRISPARDMLKQLLAEMADDFLPQNNKKRDRINGVTLSATVMGTGGAIGLSKSKDDIYFDAGVEIEKFLEKAQKLNKKILIGIDEISKNSDVVTFVSEFGKWLRADYPIYLVCTGLYENIEQLYNVPNLTFFRRATTVQTCQLNLIKMTEMYRKRLGIDTSEAKKMADFTCGYAYAFQELGVLKFKHREYSDEELVSDLKTELYAYAYEKIWEELSEGDRELVRLLTNEPEYKKSDIVNRMKKPTNYPVYRDRLLRRGIIKKRQGYIGLVLPYFGDYINEYNK